jgi:His/Glu/Gln/Arg/opine family amino acid ABC transporter permease subunit
VIALVSFVATSSPGWETFKITFFNVEHARAVFGDVLKAFWVNVKLFLLAEPLILVLALAVALCRQARSPWLAPLRLLAVVYTDIFRGIPTILLVLLMGFGMPALQLQGMPTSLFFWALVSLVLSYGAYVAGGLPGRYRVDPPVAAGQRRDARPHPRPGDAPRGGAAGRTPGRTPTAQRLHLAAEGHRTGHGRRAVGRHPRRQRLRVVQLQLHLVRGGVAVLHRPDRADGAVHRLAAAALCRAGEGGRAMSLLHVSDLRKSYGERVVLHDIDLSVESGEVVCLIGSSGSGKSTLLRCINLLEHIDDGIIEFNGVEISDRG